MNNFIGFMRTKLERKTNERTCKPFLLLPMIENISEKRNVNMTNKNTSLKLFTKTWPPKRENKHKKGELPPRPLTATLEEPTILNISLIGKIDMSKIRKEFLNISNLCRVPLILNNRRILKLSRPLSLPPNEKTKRKKKFSDVDDSCEDEISSHIPISARKAKNNRINSKIKKSEVTSKQVNIGVIKGNNVVSDANNNKTYKLPRKPSALNAKLVNGKNDMIKSTKLPEPCKTCGRPEQPERFHSHPVTPMKTARKVEGSPKVPVKSTVQKPIAIKYSSKTSAEKKPTPIRKTIHSPQKSVQPPSNGAPRLNHSTTPSPKPAELAPRVRSAKRTLTCYLCGREFGTASLHLHEPKCLQRWERENANLPPHLRRKPPPKPDHSVSKEEWDKLAWESSQATLTPCQNCGRTFYPDRLIVHQRSCKTPQANFKSSSSDIQPLKTNLPPVSHSTPTTPSNRRGPISVECNGCGKMFGSNSIRIHERQCLKKNETNIKHPVSTRNSENKLKTSESLHNQLRQDTEREKEDRPKSAKRPALFPCYICGKLFTVNSMDIHEPQCLKKWKIENDKLPSHQRRPVPSRPDIRFTAEGKIDFEATNEAHWRSHLSQLVPCRYCPRTFNPDRVEVHERSCKGS